MNASSISLACDTWPGAASLCTRGVSSGSEGWFASGVSHLVFRVSCFVSGLRLQQSVIDLRARVEGSGFGFGVWGLTFRV